MKTKVDWKGLLIEVVKAILYFFAGGVGASMMM